MAGKKRHAVAALAYLGLVLWLVAPVLPMLADGYPNWAGSPHTAVGDHDQSYMVWSATRNARTLFSAPWRLWDFEVCHPFPRAVALGHHGYASGLLVALPYAATGEPILAFNVVSILMLWLSALGMYALAYHWTRSTAAAFVGGLLFGFQLFRLTAVRWPAIVGNEWTPLALLFTHRVFERGRWRDAAALAFFVSMQILESFYQMVPLAIFGLVYGGVLAWRHRGRLFALAPKLAAVAAVAAAVTAVVAIPYVDARTTWDALEGHRNFFPALERFAPGQVRYPGTMLLVLAAVGLADRLRRRRGDDPRGPLAIAGLVVFALIVGGVGIPGRGFVLSPGQWLVPLVPGLGMVRGLQFGIVGVWLSASLLASYGTLVLVERRSPPVAGAIGIAIAVLVLGEAFHPAWSAASFGADGRQIGAPLSVPRDVVRLLDATPPDGAVLDLPARTASLAFAQRGHRVLLAAFHRRPTTGCCGSFPSPLAAEVEELGLRLPDRAAAEALHALGFQSVLLHEEEHAPKPIDLARRLATLANGNPRLTETGATDAHRVYRLETTTPVRSDVAMLAAGASDLVPPVEPRGPADDSVVVTFRNAGPATFRHPDPIAPTGFVARCRDERGVVVAESRIRAMLPLALAAGDTLRRSVRLAVPATLGVYAVTLAPADAPDRIVAVGRVAVGPVTSGPPR